MKSKKEENISLLFETSWEVCNKVGGIYTVLSSASGRLSSDFGDSLVFVGPDLRSDAYNSNIDFIPRKTLCKKSLAKLDLPYGIKVTPGRWNVPGKPQAILVDYKGVFAHLNDYFGQMWNDFGVDSLHEYGDYRESCAFSIAASIAIRAISTFLREEKHVVAHFHEWTTGMGLLDTLKEFPEAATVFTTHATSIGRSISGNGKPLYDYFSGYDGDQMARELNMEAKHSLEKAAARYADCFTTVSEVTAAECTQFLGVTPQVITPNGFDFTLVPTGTKYKALRANARKKILDVAKKICGEEYPDDTFITATSGRNEYRNKGIDLFIDSMCRISETERLSGRKILALILVPAWSASPNGLLTDEKTDSPVRFATHHLHNEGEDAIWNRLNEICNDKKGSGVTFLYVPCYLNGSDGVFDIPYYQMLPAVDATVFPSYYEPWGYTPLESISFSIPTITTDKAGFGQYILSNFDNGFGMSGVFVVKRTDSNYQEAAQEISSAVGTLSEMSSGHLEKIREAARHTAETADWNLFIKFYDKAFHIALSNRDKRMK